MNREEFENEILEMTDAEIRARIKYLTENGQAREAVPYWTRLFKRKRDLDTTPRAFKMS